MSNDEAENTLANNLFGRPVGVMLKRERPFSNEELMRLKRLAEEFGCDRLTLRYFRPTESAMDDDKFAEVDAPIGDWAI